jgi:hypothetical protein
MLERLLVFLFSIMLIVDSVNGLTMRAADFSVSAPFKGLLLVLVVLYLKRWVSVSLVLLVLLLFVFVHFFVLGDVEPAVSSSEMLFKCFSIVIFYWFFRRLLQDRDHHTVVVIAAIAGMVIVANLMVGVSGFGYAQYVSADQTTIGSRGFFYSGNELSVIYVLVVSIILMKLIVEARYFWYIAVGLISTMLSVLLATKVTILSVLLLFISFPFLSVVDRRLLNFRLSRKKFKFAALISVLFPAVVFSSVYILLYEINLIGRLEFFYSTADFVDVAMSGRNLLAADAWSIFSRDYSTIATFFGRGEYWDGSLDSSKLVEIDPVDILMTYGLIGLCLVYGFFTAIMVQVAGNVQHNPFGKYVLFTTVLLMGISFTAGHVVYSGTGGYLLAALLALGTLNSRRWLPAAQHSAVHWPGARQAG